MAVVDVFLTRIGDEAQIAQPFDLGMVAEEGADLQRVLARAAHSEFERFEAAQQHPCGVGIADRADRVAHRADRVDQRLIARYAAGDEVRVAAGIFGEAVDDEFGPLFQRLLPQRAEESIVDRDRGFRLAGEGGVARRADGFDIDERVGRVRRAFEIDERDLAALFVGQRLGPGEDRVDFLARRAGREVDEADAEARQDTRDQRFGRGIERARMDDHVILADEREEQGGDRRHAARKDEAVVGAVPDREAILEDFLVRAVETRIDEAVGGPFALAGDMLEKALARRRAFEGEGRGQEDRRLQRTFGQHRVVAESHHQRCGAEVLVADLLAVRLGFAAHGHGMLLESGGPYSAPSFV